MDITVEHDSFAENCIFTSTNLKLFSLTQIGVTEVGIFEIDFAGDFSPTRCRY